MQALNLPEYTFRTKKDEGKIYVFDVWRKKWVLMTPEEWVRQNFMRYLVETFDYPSSALGIEVGIDVAGRRLRVDAIVYSRNGERLVLLEFKAPSVSITESVFAQAADYNTKVGAPYVIVSNGLSHYCAKTDGAIPNLLDHIPEYIDL